DGSSDGTAEVAKRYGQKIQYIYQENAGPGAARNTGIKAAKCDWIAFLDADDEWAEDKLALQVELLKKNSNLAWTSANTMRCLCAQKKEEPLIPTEKVTHFLAEKNVFDYMEAFSVRIRPHTSSMLIKREVIIAAGLFDTVWRNAEDVDLWLKISYLHPEIGFVNRPLSTYHMGTAGSLATNPINYELTAAFLERHLEITGGLNVSEKFAPIAKDVLWAWVRSSFFDDRVYDTRKALEQFPQLLSNRQRSTVYWLTIVPGLTKNICRMLSFISRSLKLRKQNWHPTEDYIKQDNTEN
ncbi:MAG: glycosyltransferase, partial [Anaerohalosphaera sp.]|nr:glycosyltransferase [Anaerohalosphaera sp.]